MHRNTMVGDDHTFPVRVRSGSGIGKILFLVSANSLFLFFQPQNLRPDTFMSPVKQLPDPIIISFFIIFTLS
jgi:hypothetical protein